MTKMSAIKMCRHLFILGVDDMSIKIVGITPLYCDEKESVWMLPAYMDMLRDSGVLPIILPNRASTEELIKINSICDGYLFTGGHDVNPEMYGCKKTDKCGATNSDRDELEKKLFKIAFDSDKPILGICRGIQIINALLGGTLYQDLETEYSSSTNHHMTAPYNRHVHNVTIQNGILSGIIGNQVIGVNSYHHQAIKKLSEKLNIEAISEDGLVEGVSYPRKRFILAVQWHPELIYKDDKNNAEIIKVFADAVCNSAKY